MQLKKFPSKRQLYVMTVTKRVWYPFQRQYNCLILRRNSFHPKDNCVTLLWEMFSSKSQNAKIPTSVQETNVRTIWVCFGVPTKEFTRWCCKGVYIALCNLLRSLVNFIGDAIKTKYIMEDNEQKIQPLFWLSCLLFIIYFLKAYIVPATTQGIVRAFHRFKSHTSWIQYKPCTLHRNVKHIYIIRKLVPSV